MIRRSYLFLTSFQTILDFKIASGTIIVRNISAEKDDKASSAFVEEHVTKEFAAESEVSTQQESVREELAP